MGVCVCVGVGVGVGGCGRVGGWVGMGVSVCFLSLPVSMYRMSASVRLMSTTGWSASGSVAMQCLSQPSTSTPG